MNGIKTGESWQQDTKKAWRMSLFFRKKRMNLRWYIHILSIQNKNREAIIEKLHQNGIATGTYYPVPMHLQKVFLKLGYKEGDLPVVEDVCKNIFAITDVSGIVRR